MTRPSGPSLRVRGAVIFALVLADILLGNHLAEAGSPYPLGYLAAHIGVTVAVLAFSGHAVLASRRSVGWAPSASALLTLLASLGATFAGAAFLLEAGARGPLLGMEGFGVLAFLGTIMLIVFGGGKDRSRIPI